MRTLIAVLGLVLMIPAYAGDAPAQPNDMHRFLIERTFKPGALEGLDAATKAKVNANNASVGVRWVSSYANADKTKTYCVYEGPNEAAIRKAAALNGLPVDKVMEVPVTLTPQ
jgi:Nickel responsive protein SCO4226-like